MHQRFHTGGCMASDSVAFYNDLYMTQPGKWNLSERDQYAFMILRELVKPERVLDFGCGNGHTLEFLHDQWPEAHYTGVDISDIALRLASFNLPAGEFYQSMPQGEWDLILIMGVAEHFYPDPATDLMQIGSHLSQNGIMYLEVPNCLKYAPEKGDGFRQTIGGSGQEEWHLLRESWESIIDKAGLKIVMGVSGLAPEWEFIWILRR